MNRLIMGFFILIIIFVSGCTQPITPTPEPVPTVEGTQELQTFANFEELQAFLASTQQAAPGQATGSMDVMFARSVADSVSAPTANEMALSDGGAAQEAGSTNTQFANVDEADFIKNDNQYIYTLSGNELLIVDAANAPNANIISETEILEENNWRNRALNMFLHGDYVVVLTSQGEEVITVQKYDILPQTRYTQKTVAYVYDVSDRASPELVSTTEVSGNYGQARLIDGIMYLTTQENPWYGGGIIEPRIAIDSMPVEPLYHYFDNPETNYNYHTVLSLDIEAQEVVDTETYLLGYGSTLMMNENNMYIAYQNAHRGWWYTQNYEQERFYDVIVPELTGEVETEVKAIIRSVADEEQQWKEIESYLSSYFAEIQERDAAGENLAEYEAMMEDIQGALETYDLEQQLEQQATSIHKIAINNGELDYVAAGSVPGSLLNQFSLDEHDGNLRVATTVQLRGRNSVQYNNLFVLDDNMELMGEVTDIAPDERIYSVRFMGDEAYMVTFRQVDPFFVLDLSNPRNPEVLGELKLPGYSDYLHPLEGDLVIGVGMDTKENSWGGVTNAGVKVALFDVSDRTAPQVLDEVIMGDSGSYTPVSEDHKAFRYDAERNMLVLPVREASGVRSQGQQIRDGAYVFSVTDEGFEELAFLQHGDTQGEIYGWRGSATVLRSTYFDNYLYTLSSEYLKAYDMYADFTQVASIGLPGNGDVWY